MKIVVDMSFSPVWVPVLRDAGFLATHWSDIGKGDAPDKLILLVALTRQSSPKAGHGFGCCPSGLPNPAKINKSHAHVDAQQLDRQMITHVDAFLTLA